MRAIWSQGQHDPQEGGAHAGHPQTLKPSPAQGEVILGVSIPGPGSGWCWDKEGAPPAPAPEEHCSSTAQGPEAGRAAGWRSVVPSLRDSGRGGAEGRS